MEPRTNPRVDEKTKRFFSEDHCHICGIEFEEDEQYYSCKAKEYKPDEPLRIVDLIVHLECLCKQVDH